MIKGTIFPEIMTYNKIAFLEYQYIKQGEQERE